MGKKKNEAHFEVDRAFLVLLIASAVFLVGVKIGLSQTGTVQGHQGSEIVGPVAQADTVRDSSTGNYVDAKSLLGAVPSGAVMFFNLASCPSGWSALASAQGRYLVGTPAGGTLGTAVGTALANAENRAVGQHAHTASSSLTGAHTHGYTRYGDLDDNGGGLSSAWDRTTTVQTSSAGDHTHTITVDNAGSVAGTNAPYVQFLVCQKD